MSNYLQCVLAVSNYLRIGAATSDWCRNCGLVPQLRIGAATSDWCRNFGLTGDRQGYMLTCEYNILRVAGGFSAVKLYNRIRGDRIRGVQKVTLSYLTGAILWFWSQADPL